MWLCTLFSTKLAFEPAGAVDILNFSRFSNAMQACNGILEISCKWFWVMSIREFHLVIECSELSSQAVPPHLIMLLRSLNFDLVFKMKVSTTTRAKTSVEVRGHRETKLLYTPSGVHFHTFQVHFMAKPCRMKVTWLFQLLWVILWSTWLYDCVCQKGSFCFGSSPFGNYVFKMCHPIWSCSCEVWI